MEPIARRLARWLLGVAAMAMCAGAGAWDSVADMLEDLQRREAAGDPTRFVELLALDDPRLLPAALDWLKPRALAPGDARYAYAYAANLWRAGVADTAVAMWLYGRLAAQVDGSKCRDPSAPGGNILAWERVVAPIRMHYLALSWPDRRAMFELALQLEARQGMRPPSEWVCRGGMQALVDHLQRQAQAGTAGAENGVIRHRIPAAALPAPRYIPQAQWMTARNEALARFRRAFGGIE